MVKKTNFQRIYSVVLDITMVSKSNMRTDMIRIKENEKKSKCSYVYRGLI